MRYQIVICGKNLLLTPDQLETLVSAVQDAESLSEKHVGNGKGSQGYQMSYVPTIETKHVHDWLAVTCVTDDFVDAIKLTMKLDQDEPNF